MGRQAAEPPTQWVEILSKWNFWYLVIFIIPKLFLTCPILFGLGQNFLNMGQKGKFRREMLIFVRFKILWTRLKIFWSGQNLFWTNKRAGHSQSSLNWSFKVWGLLSFNFFFVKRLEFFILLPACVTWNHQKNWKNSYFEKHILSCSFWSN